MYNDIKMLIGMIKKIIFATVFLASTSFVIACGNETNATNSNSSAVEKNDESAIKHIDSEYMKKNIYDWESTPGEFVFKGSRPAIIDFYANWCGPCRRLSPKLEEIAKKYKGKIDVYKVNVDDEKTLADVFGVKSIPMCLFIPAKGTPIQTMGDLSIEQIEETIGKIYKK